MNIRKTTLLFTLYLALFVGVLSFANSSNASAAYNGGRIIDNNVFLNANSMNVSQIQSFLASKGSGLASRSFVLQCYGAGSQERQLYTSVGAACDQNMSAAHIIYYASRIYGINPQVIMATLQKEQSLITTGNPTSWQLNQAMGYGCPTTGNCSGNSTFSYQIDSGTWVLRYHYERANGNNNWWSPSTSWVCGTEKNFYKPNLYPGQNVRFYDGNNVLYRTHFIENAATSSFYCYTPHAYNNPRGEFGRPAFGTVGQYYSGSYNFVTAFEAWFGPTFNSGFQASYVNQSAHSNVVVGNSTRAYVRYQNSGTQPWYDDISAPAHNTYSVRLATTNPINSGNQFSAFWPSRNRAATTFARVYAADGVTLTNNQHIAQPGQIVQFDFPFSIASNTTPGTYENYFQPVLDGSAMWNMGGISRFNISVQPLLFKAEFAGQSAFPAISRGSTSNAYLRYKNTGNQPWYDRTSAAAYNTYAVHLATTNPINSASPFSSTWPSSSRPALNFARVYEADGVTLAPNQHIAQPGQIVQFDFAFSVPNDAATGVRRQHFQPILEGSTMWNMGAQSWLNVTVI